MKENQKDIDTEDMCVQERVGYGGKGGMQESRKRRGWLNWKVYKERGWEGFQLFFILIYFLIV